MNSKFYLLGVVIMLLMACGEEKIRTAPHDLKISEDLVNPIGFYDNSPTFSWKLPADIQQQTAYAIAVASSPDLLPDNADLWQTEKIESEQSLYIKYQGKALSSKQKVYWQVKYWDENQNQSAWSDTAFFELGLLNNSDWKAQWISIPTEELTEMDARKSVLFRPQYFRKEVEIESKPENARLYITAKGVYEAYINGKKVGTDVMSPGWTPHKKNISTLTYDVTDMLQEGKNTIAAIVAEGWYAGRIDLRRNLKTTAHAPHLLFQLEINDGNQTMISDKNWKVTQNGPIRTSKIYDGETYDANFEMEGWNKNDFNDSAWHSVITKEIADSIQLLPKRYQGVKDKTVLATANITQPEANKAIFDFGQNNIGVQLLKIPVKKGDTVTIRFAEMLNTDGTLYTANYRSALSTDYYIPAQDGVIEWRPTFTFHGYRYVELSGYDINSKPQKDWVNAIVQHTDFEENGTFKSSHEKLNKLQSNITWGLRSNFFDLPTDCPQRDERLGWTGDAQVIAPTSLFYADMYAFWAGYLQSMRMEQMPNGGIPHVIPNNLGVKSSSGWGDACTVIPWEIYFRTGDVNVLEENYDMMNKWLEFYQSTSKNNISNLFSFGDWLQPITQREDKKRYGDTPKEFSSTAYYARSVELTLRAAKVLNKAVDVKRLEALHNDIKQAFEKKFFAQDGRVVFEVETQTEYLLALAFDLLSNDTKQKAIPQLLRLLKERDNHLNTGFLGTPILPFVLDEIGHADLMYTVLFKETYPSWFYSINQGATTMWERWDSYTLEKGFHPQGMNSFNHYAYGAIGQWMYERIAGIKPTKAGYKEILIAPMPGGPLTSAQAKYNSPYGEVSSAWTMNNKKFELNVTIPPNTTAKIIIPANTAEDLLLNGKAFSDNSTIKLIQKNDSSFELSAFAGTYTFETTLK